MEYYPEYFENMLNIARNIGAEYLILGQHFILNEHPGGIGAGGPTDNKDHLKTYVDEVVRAMKTGVFSYIAHPDIMCFSGDDEVYARAGAFIDNI
jgi:histidinol-phosphatase (PHP family)